METLQYLTNHFCNLIFERGGILPTSAHKLFLSKILENAFEGHFCTDGVEFREDISDLYGIVIEKIEDLHQKVFLPICEYKGLYYLHRNWYLERQIAEALLSLERRDPPHLQLDFSVTNSLSEEQKQALDFFVTSNWMLLSGGPGRGKTFTAASLVAAMPLSTKVLVAAPTGKATWHLYDQIKKRAPSHMVEASTLHSLLYSMEEHQKIPHDVIIVDEASMIDAGIFHRFLDKIGPKSKLLLMGDIDQLPPVETGMVFAELFHFAQKTKKIPHVQLLFCYRSDRQDILSLAEHINNQDLSFRELSSEAVSFHSLTTYERENLLTLAKKYYLFRGDSLEDAKKRFDQFRILTAMQVGPYGVRALNEMIHDVLLKEKEGGSMFPVLITKTNYELGIFNGETGFVMKNRVYLQKEKGWISLPLPVIPSYELAYAMTVHKSQGSEYDHVILILPEGSEVFGKELIYTGVTRTRKKLEIISTEKTFKECLAKKSKRKSCLASHLEG